MSRRKIIITIKIFDSRERAAEFDYRLMRRCQNAVIADGKVVTMLLCLIGEKMSFCNNKKKHYKVYSWSRLHSIFIGIKLNCQFYYNWLMASEKNLTPLQVDFLSLNIYGRIYICRETFQQNRIFEI